MCQSYLLLSVSPPSMSKSVSKSKAASERHFRCCVSPCSRFLAAGVTHDLCALCLGAEHARSALEGADCHDCELLSLRVRRSRLAVFDESSQARDPVGSGPVFPDLHGEILRS